ncbi:MAG TPA: hypothetical protein VGV09_15165 [Steroidobacteraceae bacterium]|nr:hypothetical protein [Steroidobacteraceae bacterium]
MTEVADSPPGMISVETVHDLEAPTATRNDWETRVGTPDYTSRDGRFIAYQRGTSFRNVWQTPSASPNTSLPTGSERDTMQFYQVLGVWLDSTGHVRKTRQFLAPCGACSQGEHLMSDAEIDQWRLAESPHRS